jgi:hypothetical protein
VGWRRGGREFGEKQTTGQIVFDAVLSMFPLLGEGTAARDAIAICLRMSEDREKAEDRWEWIKLVLCLIAVVPLETAPKTVPQGYSTRVPATARHTVPNDASEPR